MRRVTVVLAPLAAALLLLAVAFVPTSDEGPRGPREVEVGQVTYACPAGGGRTVAATQVTAGETAEATTLPDGEPVPDLAAPDGFRTASPDVASVLVTQSGPGTGAVGFAAGTQGGDLSATACPGVVDDAWFTGLGSTTQHVSTLLLTNLAEAPAVADVSLWGPEGPVEAVGADGVVVEPGTTLALPLADLAAGEDDLAVRVERRRGALSAVAADRSPGGRDLVPSAAAPTRELVVGPLPASGASRSLRLVNPGEDTATVAVGADGQDGSFVPEGLDELDVPPGGVRVVDLPDVLGDGPATLRLRSDAPVTGSVLTTTRSDTSVVPATTPWDGAAVVPVDVGAATLDSLVLGAVGTGATVAVRALDAAGETLGEADVEVGADASAVVDLDDLVADGTRSLVLESGTAVMATASFTAGGGDGVGALAVGPAPVTAQGPTLRWGAPRG